MKGGVCYGPPSSKREREVVPPEDLGQKPERVARGAEARVARQPRALRLRVLVFVLAAVLAVVVGQLGRDLLPPDDLREAEIAREMWASGDYVLPRLAGLPFVEKPPGFQVVVASAFAWTGGPSTAAARVVTAGFALLTLLAVFALGEEVLGLEGAALAVAFLGLSQRFCRTAHTVLLDNALTAALAFALLFVWRGLREEKPRAKERAYAAAGLALGISFLFKGFVGPLLFGTGALAYLAATRRLGELRSALRPLPVAAFLLPPLLWIVPFVARASPDLVRAFFISNHWGRATAGYASNVRPFYFYLLDLWRGFLPAAALLPFAAFSAVRRRHTARGQTEFFFLSFAAAPILLLSFSKAKDSVYALPAYPALALLTASWCEEKLRGDSQGALRGTGAAAVAAVAASGTAVGATVYFAGFSWYAACALVVLVFLSALAVWFGRRRELLNLAAASVATLALAWVLWFTGPLAQHEVARRSIRAPVEAALAQAGNRTVLLYNPSDGLRGAASFWRNRTALEVQDLPTFVRRLVEDPNAVGLFHTTVRSRFLEPLLSAFSKQGAEPIVEASFPSKDNRVVLLWGARSLTVSDAAR
jgi:4-amino-4-deoxy-L-arabinose transferase-like glycosyltransferase